MITGLWKKPEEQDREAELLKLMNEIRDIRKELRASRTKTSHESFENLAREQKRLVELLRQVHPNYSNTAKKLYS